MDYTHTKNILHTSQIDQQNPNIHPGQGADPSNPPALPIPEFPVQLDLLVEEVVDSVLAGHSFWNMSVSDPKLTAWSTATSGSYREGRPAHRVGASCPPSLRSSPRAQSPSNAEPAVQVYLDIDPCADWSYATHPGAFRRIIMNLVGNALKFTESGSIMVSLRQDDPQQNHGGSHRTMVRLTVSDTGKGISENYLRNDIFTPFSQEDSFVPGTGLGLSLVRQMVSVLGGSIEVSSHVGQGTTVVVSTPLPHCEEVSKQEIDFQQDIQTLAGQRVQIHGFEATRFRGHGNRRGSNSRLVERICGDWLHMEIAFGAESNSSAPDFIVSTIDKFSHPDASDPVGIDTSPHIFICPDSAAAREMGKLYRFSSRTEPIFLTQP